MKIDVTQKDIDSAKTLIASTNIRSTNYPIVLAIKKVLPNKDISIVSGYDRQVKIDDKFYYIACDASKTCDISVFLNRFDLGKTVQPFSFELYYSV